MHTLVLAGGFGTRLQPVLGNLPKPLAPVEGKPFLEYGLGKLKEYGLVEFTLCLHYMSGKIMEYFGDGSGRGIKIDYSIEERPMGTGGAVGLLRKRLKETFCVLNGDTYLELDMRECISGHRQRRASVTMAAVRTGDAARFGRLDMDSGGFVKGFCEKDEARKGDGYINAGLYILEPEIFGHIPENRPVSLEKEVFPAMLERKIRISGYPYVDNFFDIGIPADYERFRKWVKGFRSPEEGKGGWGTG